MNRRVGSRREAGEPRRGGTPHTRPFSQKTHKLGSLTHHDFKNKFQSLLEQRNRFLARDAQFRSEAPCSFVTIRDGPVPFGPGHRPYFKLRNLDKGVRLSNGCAIFERVVGYLSLLAAKKIYPRGDLVDQVIVLLDETVTPARIVSIQFLPKSLSPSQVDSSQLLDLMAFLGVQDMYKLPQFPEDLYFENASTCISSIRSPEDFVRNVNRIDDIDLVNDYQCIFFCEGQPLSTQKIFEHKKETFADPDNSLEFWVLMSRFCNEHTTVSQLHLLPRWLEEYVRYDAPRALPSFFTHLINTQDPLKRLRIVLGMYPEKLSMLPFDVDVDPLTLQVFEQLPIWYQQRLRQVIYISENMRRHDAISKTSNVIVMNAPRSVEEFLLLFADYE